MKLETRLKKNEFLKEQLALNNIKVEYNSYVRVGSRSMLKNNPNPQQPKRFKDKITATLRKLGYEYSEKYDVYYNIKYIFTVTQKKQKNEKVL